MRPIDADKLKEKLQKMISQVGPGNPERGFALQDVLDEVNAAETILMNREKGSIKEMMDTVGKRLRYLRQNAGMTMQELADKIGISVKTIWRLENDKLYKTDFEVIRRLCRTLHVTADWLLGV